MMTRLSTWAALTILVAACSASAAPEETGSEGATQTAAPTGNEGRGSSAPEELVDAGSGTAWTDLYRDLFGPTGGASCAGTGMCHGSAGESGALGSQGYVCASREGCRESMLSAETLIVQASDSNAPERSSLVATLRRRSGTGTIVGTMPKRSQYVFSRQSIARIETWIRNGAPDD